MIEDFLMTGIQTVGSTTGLVKSWTYAPANAMVDIPQQAMPLGINLSCFAIPSDAKDEEVVIRDFEFVPEGTPIPDAGAGSGGDGDASADAGVATDSGESGDSDAGAGPSRDSAAGVSADAAVSADAGVSADADSGGPASPSSGDAPARSSSGCSCTIARTENPAAGALLFLSAALVAVRRRASRRRGPTRRDRCHRAAHRGARLEVAPSPR